MKVNELLQELEAETVFHDTSFNYNDEDLECLTKIPLKERKLEWNFLITIDKFFDDKISDIFQEKYFDFFEIEGKRKTNKTTTYTTTGINIVTGNFVQVNPKTYPVYNTLNFRGRFYNDYEGTQRERIFERIKYLIGLSFPKAIFVLKK